MRFLPAYETLGDGPRLAVLLHGILGNRKNLRGLASRLVAARPDFRVRLLDHRHHGDSGSPPPPDTLEACVDDALALGDAPEVVVGHSFGGKVALAWARRRPPGLRQVWSLDSPPFALEPPPDHGVLRVLTTLRRIPLPFARRNDVVDACVAHGLDASIGRWMTTNLRRDDDGFRWVFDLDGAEALIADYFRQDLADALDGPVEAWVVRAADSDRWPDPWIARLEASRRYLVLPDAGHWLHVDNPDGLLAMLLAHWPPETP